MGDIVITPASNDVNSTAGTLNIRTSDSYPMLLKTSNVERISITAAGLVGIGTTAPTGKLHVYSSITGDTLIRADGTNGTIFSVTDDLSNSLLSVNNSAGLPVLEVFADDSVVMGQYGSGDFVLRNNKIGIGTTNPVNKLSVIGSASIGSAGYNVNAPSNGLIVEGTVGIGITNPNTNYKLDLSSANDGYARQWIASTAFVGTDNGTNGFQIRVLGGGTNGLKISNSVNNVEYVRISSDGKVGIGTIAPTGFLTIQANSDQLRLQTADGPGSFYTYISSPYDSSHPFSISVANNSLSTAEYFAVYADAGGANNRIALLNGNVGIGTTVPTGLLNVTRNSNTAQPIAFFKELFTNPAATNLLLLERGNNLSAANQTTSNAGLRIRDHSSNYSLSIEDHNSNVNFAISGTRVLVGSRGTNSLLNVGGAGSIAPSSGITFGGDAQANLYRVGEDSIQTDGNLYVAGTTVLQGDKYLTTLKSVFLVARGAGLNNNASRYLAINNTAIYNNTSRGLRLTIINATNLAVVSNTDYDTVGSDAACDDLATAINGMTSQQIGVLTSYDAWERDSANLRVAALNVGLTKLGTYSTGGTVRKPYAAVFNGTSDTANATTKHVIERMESSDADATRALITTYLTTDGAYASIDAALHMPNVLYASDADIEYPIVLVDSVGRVGIGTTVPSGALNIISRGSVGFVPTATGPIGGSINARVHIQGNEPGLMLSSDIQPVTGIQTNTQAYQLGLQIGYYAANDVRNQIYFGNGPLTFTYSANQGVAVTERMRIDTAGRVGIGTNSALAQLHVTGQTYLTNVVASVARNQLTINTNGANYAHFYDVGVSANNALALGGNGAIGTVPTKAIMSWRLSTENVGIGLTNPEATSALHIKNLDAAAKVTIESADGSESFINFSAQSSEYSVGFVRDGSNVNSLRFCAADGLSANEVMRLQNTNVGIGTNNPVFGLDVYKDSFRSLSRVAEKAIVVTFPNGVANQKVDIVFDVTPGTNVFWGNLEVEITDGFSNQLATGKLIKVFSLGLNPATGSGPYGAALYDNASYYTAAYGAVADNYAIDGIFFNTTTGKYYFTIIHRTSTGNAPVIKIKGFTVDVARSVNINSLTAGTVYTTNTTVYHKPVVETLQSRIGFNGNIDQSADLLVRGLVGLGTTNPSSRLVLGSNFASVSGITVSTDNFLESQFVARKAASKCAFGVLAWEAEAYLSAGTYYNNGNWQHHNANNNNLLFVLTPGGGVNWYASNNGSASWNVAEALNLWDQAGRWKSSIQSARAENSYILSGNVGIGTTNPTQKLDIVGSYGAPDDDGGMLKIRGSGVGPTQLNFGVSADGGYGWIQTTDIGASNERNIILNPLDGNVGIGTTNPLSLLGVGAAGSTTAANGLTFGQDAQANLYRVAEDTIRTDGSFIAVGNLTVGNSITASSEYRMGLYLGYVATFPNIATAAFRWIILGPYNDTLTVAGNGLRVRGELFLSRGSNGENLRNARLKVNIGQGYNKDLLHADVLSIDSDSTTEQPILYSVYLNGFTSKYFAIDAAQLVSFSPSSLDAATVYYNGQFYDQSNDARSLTIQANASITGAIGVVSRGGKIANALFAYTGNIGIGIAVPSAKLEVNGPVFIPSTNGLYLGGTAGSFTSWQSVQYANNGYHVISSNGLVINNAGYSASPINAFTILTNTYDVGLSTNAPAERLHVYKTGLANNSTNSLLLLDGKFTAAGVDSDDIVGIAFRVENSAGGAQRTTSVASSYQAGYNALLLQHQGGNVGISTTNPTYKLDLEGVSTTSVVQNVRNPSLAWNQYALTRYQTDTKNSRYVDVGYFRGVSNEDTRGFVISGLNSNILTLLDIAGGYNLGLGGVTAPLFNIDVASTQGKGIQLRYDTGTGYRAQITPYWNTTTDTRIDFAINRSANLAADVIMSVGYSTNVGIGTTQPSQKLDIVGSYGAPDDNAGILKIKGPGVGPTQLNFGVSADGGYGWIQATDIAVDNDRNIILAPLGGNVGIGTTNPYSLLDVQVASASPRYVTISTNDGQGSYYGFGLNFRIADNAHDIGQIRGVYENSNGGGFGGLAIATRFGGTLYNRVTFTDQGRVGIGMTNPTTLLSVGGAGSTTAASGITFGADSVANLYRISASRIKTDGSITIDGGGGNAQALVLNRSSTSSENGISFNTAGSTDWYYFVDNGTTNLQIQRGTEIDSAPRVRFNGANSDILFNLGGGNIGVGTATPTGKLHIYSTITGQTLIRADGTNGTIFSVIDDLSNSLLSVNNSAGIPVLEVFADDSIVMGQYGSGDLVVTSNKVGIGTTNPTNKLSVIGSASIGSTSYNVAAPANGLIVQGTVGIGLTNPTQKLHVKSSVGQDGVMIDALQYSEVAYKINGSAVKAYAALSSIAGGYIVGSSANSFIIRNDSDIFMSADAGVTSNITIKNNGNVGIGLTNPSDKFIVNGNIGFAGDTNRYIYMPDIYQGTGSIYMQAGFGSAAAGGAIKLHGHLATTYIGGDVEVGMSEKGDFLINTAVGGTRRVTVKNDGNVGIGTITPSGKLHIGTASYNSSNRPLIVNNGVQTVNARLYDTAVIQQDDVTTLRLVERNAAVANQILSFSIGDGVARIACTAQPMQFYVNGGDGIGDYGYLGLNGTKAIEISTTANVGIGNVTPSAARLHIKGDGTNPVLRVETALLQGAAGGTAGKTFVGWMPIQTGALSPGDTVYIPLYK